MGCGSGGGSGWLVCVDLSSEEIEGIVVGGVM